MSNTNAYDILIVEDNPLDLEMTLRGLRKAKVANRIEVARDGAEALEILFREGPHAQRHPSDRPHLVLLDLKLPKVDGLEVLARLKADPATRGIPVVMLTSSSEQRDLVESYQLGVNSYIVKPVNFEKFVEAMVALGSYWLLLNQAPGPLAGAEGGAA